jgi:hypothetical protein
MNFMQNSMNFRSLEWFLEYLRNNEIRKRWTRIGFAGRSYSTPGTGGLPRSWAKRPRQSAGGAPAHGKVGLAGPCAVEAGHRAPAVARRPVVGGATGSSVVGAESMGAVSGRRWAWRGGRWLTTATGRHGGDEGGWHGGASQKWWLSGGGGATRSSSSAPAGHGESFRKGEGRRSSRGGSTSSRRWRWLSMRVLCSGDDCVVASSDPGEGLWLRGKVHGN